MDPIRPAPPSPWTSRVTGWLGFLGFGRLLAAGASVALVVGGCWWLLQAPPPPVEQSLPFAAGAVASTTVASSTSAVPPPSLVPLTTIAAPTTVVVQAAGAVNAPGVYRLPVGARVQDLVLAAGGATSNGDPDALLLASVLTDGARVYVPTVGEDVDQPLIAGAAPPPGGEGPPSAAGGSVTAPSSGPIDLNRATEAELDTLPGVGPATAAAIIAYRAANGPFATVEGLLEVRGIGPAKFEAIKPLVAV